VTLAAKPTSQKPTFTSGCAKGDKTASCTVGSVSDKQTVSLDAQIPVASGASSVSSVTLTATASVVTSATWTPPAADEAVAVSAATPAAAKAKAKPSASASPQSPLPLGPIPALNNVSSSLIGAGNAAGLFPAIVPSSAAPTRAPGSPAQGTRRNAAPVADSSALAPVLTAQVAGLIALALAIALTVTRLSVTKRLGFKKRGR
jgi:hypothetical protein